MQTHIPDIADLPRMIDRAARMNDAFMNGRMQEWVALARPSADFSIMTPFGGWSSGGFDATPERLADLARVFPAGKTGIEVIAAHASGDLSVLAVIERQTAVVHGMPEQDWSLRVTLVFRRNGDDWDLIHRHADPLVQGISIGQSAALARGADPA